VNEFDDLEKKAEAYAEEHPEQAGQGINEVAGSPSATPTISTTSRSTVPPRPRSGTSASARTGRATRTSRKPADRRNVMAAVLRRRGLRIDVREPHLRAMTPAESVNPVRGTVRWLLLRGGFLVLAG